MTSRPLLVVRLRVDPEQEEEFNRWYHRDYLDTLAPVAPLFTRITRYASRDGDHRNYLTVYEIADVASIDRALAVFDRPDRQEHRRQWKAWEQRAVREIDARVYVPIYP